LTKEELEKVNERRLAKVCDLCGGASNVTKKFEGHHLSYDPEIVVSLCVKCHDLLHSLAKLSQPSRETALNWVKVYSHQWKERAKYAGTMWERIVGRRNSIINREKIYANRRKRYNEDPIYKENIKQHNKIGYLKRKGR
jgi:hypothetical protein